MWTQEGLSLRLCMCICMYCKMLFFSCMNYSMQTCKIECKSEADIPSDLPLKVRHTLSMTDQLTC